MTSKPALVAVSVFAFSGAAFAAGGTPDSQSGFDKLDTNRDGYISAAEAAKDIPLSSDFKKFDLNNDGKLNHVEYLGARAKEDTVSTADKVKSKVQRNSSAGSSGATDPRSDASSRPSPGQ
jgi:hypothetical protein